MNKKPILKHQYDQLAEKIKRLEKKAEELGQALGDAGQHGDLFENAEFDSARDDLYIVDRQLDELYKIFRNCEIINTNDLDGKTVEIGTRVTINDLKNKRKIEYVIGGYCSDFDKGEVSYDSPVGQGLLGARKLELREIDIPAGKLHYIIEKIEVINDHE